MPKITVPVAATGLPIASRRSRSLMASTEPVGPNRYHMGTVEPAQPSRMDIHTAADHHNRHDIVTDGSTSPAANPRRHVRKVSAHALTAQGGKLFPPLLPDLIAREKLRTRIEAAVARLIDALDAIDAPAEDMEASNGGYSPSDGNPATVDVEGDGSDDEETLGWPENVGQATLGNNTADGDHTAPERHGAGFVRCAPDDHEDGHDAEASNEDGGDINDEPHDGDTDIEPEDYRGGYLTSDIERFATTDVHEAVAQVRRDLSKVRFKARGTPTMLTGFGSLPGGIPIIGAVHD